MKRKLYQVEVSPDIGGIAAFAASTDADKLEDEVSTMTMHQNAGALAAISERVWTPVAGFAIPFLLASLAP